MHGGHILIIIGKVRAIPTKISSSALVDQGIFLCTLRIIKIIEPDRSNRVLACLEHRWHVGFQPCIVRAVDSSSDNGEVTSFQPLSDNWFLALIILDDRFGVPISCICSHIDAARRVAVGATRHAFLALHTSCRVAAPTFCF